MLDPGAIAIVVEILPADAFYINAHKILYRAAISLHNQILPTDLMCIMSWLSDHDQLAAIGGKGKLVQIMDRAVSSLNIDVLANLLLEKYERRCLIHAANEARGLAHDGSVPIEEVKDRTEQLIYEITKVDAGANQVESFEEISPRIWERLEQGRSLGIKTGFLDLDEMTGGFYPGTLTIAAARTGLGKTQLAIALTYEIAKQGLPVIFFSCEMSKEDIGDRLLARAALVDSNKLREGKISPEDWEHLTAALANLNELPVHIHSVPNPSITQIRSVVRSVAAQYGGKLGLVVLDYIQLLGKDGANFNNRASELDTIVKEFRALAKEFNVACFGLAQINRGVEGRSDKRPFLSDIRECLSGDSLLINADTGVWTPIKDIRVGDQILCVDKNQKVKSATIANVWNKGEKEVFAVRTKTGRTIKATANHPFLTAMGYVPLKELSLGSVVATAMRLPEHGQEIHEKADLCRMLGYLAGNGTYHQTRSVGFITADAEIFDDFTSIIGEYFPEVSVRRKGKLKYYEAEFCCTYENGWGKPGGNPLKEWLRGVGVLGQDCSNKRVAPIVFEAGIVGAKEFISGYLATDGCVKLNTRKEATRVQIHFDTVSLGLAQDVQKLLLRLGIVSTIGSPAWNAKSTRPIYRLHIGQVASNTRRFIAEIDCRGKKGRLLQSCVCFLAKTETNNGLLALPAELSKQMHQLDPIYVHQGKRPNRSTAARIAIETNSKELQTWAESDLLWEPILSIEPAGSEETWDIEVPETGNFLANSIVVHNSGAIESHSDVVLLLYREDYYNPDTPDHGIIEIAVAKNRYSKSGVARMLFSPEYSLFRNMVRDTRHSNSK